jgi:hypothetical protein
MLGFAKSVRDSSAGGLKAWREERKVNGIGIVMSVDNETTSQPIIA